jgi:hypothetical protein
MEDVDDEGKNIVSLVKAEVVASSVFTGSSRNDRYMYTFKFNLNIKLRAI